MKQFIELFSRLSNRVSSVSLILSLIVSGGIVMIAFQNCGEVNVAGMTSELNTCVDPSGSSPTAILDSISTDNKSILSAYVIEIRFSDRQLLSSIKEFNWFFDEKPQPPKSSIFNHDISGLIACSSHKITAQWIDSCNQPRQLIKNYIHPGDNCQEIVFSCQGTTPANANLCTQDDKDLTSDTDRTLADRCSAAKCEYTCATGYTNNGGVCTQIPATFVCQGNIPDHSVICPDDDRNLTTNTNRTLVNSCSVPAGSVPKCEYICEAGYHKDGNACVPDVFECQGAVPDHATLCPSDDTGLTSNATRTLVGACSSPLGSVPKCEYTCATGYINVSGVCMIAPPPPPVAAACPTAEKPHYTLNMINSNSGDHFHTGMTSNGRTEGTIYDYENIFSRIEGRSYGDQDVLIIKLVVSSDFSTTGKQYLPSLAAANSPVTAISQRDVSISLCPNDFSSSAKLLVSSTADFAIQFTTEISRSGVGIGLIKPSSIYYLNIKNLHCPAARPGEDRSACDVDGLYKNWNQ